MWFFSIFVLPQIFSLYYFFFLKSSGYNAFASAKKLGQIISGPRYVKRNVFFSNRIQSHNSYKNISFRGYCSPIGGIIERIFLPNQSSSSLRMVRNGSFSHGILVNFHEIFRRVIFFSSHPMLLIAPGSPRMIFFLVDLCVMVDFNSMIQET